MDRFDIKNEKEFDIIYNSYRMKIIDAFGISPNMTATFKQIADRLGDNSSKVTYHCKMLIDIGLLELDHTELINGITAKYYTLVSDNFKIAFDHKSNKVIQKKIMKSQAQVAYDGLKDMQTLVSDLNHEQRSIAFVHNELHLTKEDMKEYWQLMEKLVEKKVPQEDTFKVTLYTLLINDHEGEK